MTYEQTLLYRMTTDAGMAEVIASGLRIEVFEKDIHKDVFSWMLDYWELSGKQAPPPGILADKFPRVTIEDGEGSIEFLVDALKERWATNILSGILVQTAEKSAKEDNPRRILEMMRDDLSSALEVLNQIGQEPIPLTQLIDIPPFPVDALPLVFATTVRSLAQATQTEPAMAAMSVLTVLSTCTGGRVRVAIRHGWGEPCNLYCLTIAPSGERKSAVQDRLVRPIRELERLLTNETNLARTRAEHQRQWAAKYAERLLTAAARNPEQHREAALEAAVEAEAIVVPSVPRLLADDVTPESATSLVAEQGGRLAIMSAEGGLFDAISGRYGSVPNMELWLKGHPGDALRVDRIGRPPEYISNPALTLGLMVQPSVLTDLASQPRFRDRGLLARFLYAMPEPMAGSREVAPDGVDPEVDDIYDTAVTMIAEELIRRNAMVELKLDDDAQCEFQRIEARVESMLRPEGELALLKDWGSKLAGAIARLAGILHIAEYGVAEGSTRLIGVETIKAASRMGDYFRVTAISAFTEMGRDPVTVNAIYLLDRITKMNAEEVNERELMRSARKFKTIMELRSAIRRLIDHGYLHKIFVAESIALAAGGRPESVRYRVHSAVRGKPE